MQIEAHTADVVSFEQGPSWPPSCPWQQLKQVCSSAIVAHAVDINVSAGKVGGGSGLVRALKVFS